MSNKFEEIRARIQKRAIALATMLSVVTPITSLAKETNSFSENPRENTIENTSQSDRSECDVILQMLDGELPAIDYVDSFANVDKLVSYRAYIGNREQQKLPKIPHYIENMTDVNVKKLDDAFSIGNLAEFNSHNIKINVYDSVNEKYKKLYTPQQLETYGKFYRLFASLFHELGHYQDFKINDLYYAHCSPSNIVRSNQFTEIKSKSIEFIYLASTYENLKEKNIENLTFKGSVFSREDLLDYYKPLKDYVLKNGFDVNNKDQLRDIVSLAKDFWLERHKEGYKEQAKGLCNNFFDASHFSLAPRRSKDERTDEQIYNDFISRALKDVYVGNNTRVDLSHCKDLIDFMDEEEASKILGDKIEVYENFILSPKTMVEIQKYMKNKKGIKDDYEQYEYYHKEYMNILKREKKYRVAEEYREDWEYNPLSYEQYKSLGDDALGNYFFITNEKGEKTYLNASYGYDQKLKDIIARIEGKITYADGITEYFEDGKRVAVEKDGKRYDVRQNEKSENDMLGKAVNLSIER